MTLSEVNTLLKRAEIPLAYRAFEAGKAPPLPFVCWYSDGDDNFSADGKVYYNAHAITIELYSRFVDEASERKIEDVLSEFFYQKNRSYIDDENCYVTYYELEV